MMELTNENLIECREKSKMNDSEAICDLARFYYYGECVNKDLQYAFDLWKRSSELGNARAFYNLGWCFQHGDGTAIDNSKAVEYYKKAAELSYGDAFYTLGNFYYYGELDVDIDKELAFSYYLKGANLGNYFCYYSVGWFYSHGEIVEKNHEKALQYYKKAAESGHGEALYTLGNCYYYGELDVDIDKELAFSYYMKGAKSGNDSCYYSVGWFYSHGEIVEKNHEKALEWFKKGYLSKNVDCISALGDCYYKGLGVERNHEKAYEYFSEAAKLGDAYSQCRIGDYLESGMFGNNSKHPGIPWYEKAAEQGNMEAIIALCRYYAQKDKDENKDVNKITEALKWYEKGAELGDTDCMELAALSYKIKGYSIRKIVGGNSGIRNSIESLQKGLYWAGKARDSGDYKAIKYVDSITEELGISYYYYALGGDFSENTECKKLERYEKSINILKSVYNQTDNPEVYITLALCLKDYGELKGYSEENNRLEFYLYHKCADVYWGQVIHSNIAAAYLGIMYLEGRGCSVDYNQAYFYLTKAHNAGFDCSDLLSRFKKKIFGGYVFQ